MQESAAFYKIFYQNDLLFRVEEPVPRELDLDTPIPNPTTFVEIEHKVVPEKSPELQEPNEVPPVLEKRESTSEDAELANSVPPLPPAPHLKVPEVSQADTVPPFPELQHQILVIVDEKRQAELLPAEALLLKNILKATGYSATETDLLNFSYLPQADARTVLATKSTHHFISFGVPLIKLQIDLLLPPYIPKQVEGIWFLLADPLPTIDADKALKKRLWYALQKMFALP